MQLVRQNDYPMKCVRYYGHCDRLPPRCQPYMLEMNSFVKRQMLRLTNRETGRCASWCALVVLLAVCSVAVSVATRYSSAESSSAASKTLQRHGIHEPSRQRLTLDAGAWIPPVIVSALWHTPSVYPRVISGGPIFLNRFVESSLYNRPPPLFSSL